MKRFLIALLLLIAGAGCGGAPEPAAVRYVDMRCQQLYEMEGTITEKGDGEISDQQIIDRFNWIYAGEGLSRYDYLPDDQYEALFQIAWSGAKMKCMDAEPSGPWGDADAPTSSTTSVWEQE